MKTRTAMLFLVLAAGCKVQNNSALVITKVIPPTATAVGGGTSQTLACKFDPQADEFTPFLRFNPLQNQGLVGAVVLNTIVNTATVNTQLRTDASAFLPHQAVISYEFINAGGASAPSGQTTVAIGGAEVPGGGTTSVIGIPILAGVNFNGVAAGGYIRTTFHFEGKLVDGTTVHTSEREYLFQICLTSGCSDASPQSTLVNGAVQSCL